MFYCDFKVYLLRLKYLIGEEITSYIDFQNDQLIKKYYLFR